MKKYNFISILLIATLVIFSACSNKDEVYPQDMYSSGIDSPSTSAYSSVAKQDSLESRNISADDGSDEAFDDSITEEGSGYDPSTLPEDKRKLVITTSMMLETKAFDDGLLEIYSFVEKNGGYIEVSSISGQSLYNQGARGARYANFTVRIPTKSKGLFLDNIKALFNVTQIEESTNDITASYYDTDTWLKTLEEQYKRLEALLEEPGDLEYLLQVEKELSATRYEINSVYNQLKHMDSQVDYSTVYLSLSEVVEYENIDPLPVSFIERTSQAFSGSWRFFVELVKDAIIFLIYALPIIVVIAIVAIILIALSKKRRKNKLAKNKLDSTNDSPPSAEAESKNLDDKK